MIDLNADMGEFTNDDEEEREARLIGLISSCSIACGGHSGTRDTMRRTVKRALAACVQIGAHPSYPDKEHFGRRSLQIDYADLLESLQQQIAALEKIVQANGGQLAHVKPHGALYNDAAADPRLARIVISAAPSKVAIFGPPASELEKAAQAEGRRFVAEGFADRCYLSRGVLAPRSRDDAILRNLEERTTQALALATGAPIDGVNERFSMAIETLCIHGDDPMAVATAQALRAAFAEAAIKIGPPT